MSQLRSTPCKVEGCERPCWGLKDGMCHQHHRHGIGYVFKYEPSMSHETIDATQRCSVPKCNHVRYTRGFCAKHYQRQRRYGDVNYIGRLKPRLTNKARAELGLPLKFVIVDLDGWGVRAIA
jgi:hypothetical protein